MPDVIQPEAGFPTKLNDRLAAGQRLAQAPDLSQGQVRMWTLSVRVILMRLFGHESALLVHWPPASGPLPPGDAKVTLGMRLAGLKALIAYFSDRGRPFQSDRGR